MGLLTQFTLLLWKNFTLRKRQKVRARSRSRLANRHTQASIWRRENEPVVIKGN